jgi:hypothetical protein
MKTLGWKRGKITGEWRQLTEWWLDLTALVFIQCSCVKSGGAGMHVDKQDMHTIECAQGRSHQRAVAAADLVLGSLGLRTSFQLQNLYGCGFKWVSELECGCGQRQSRPISRLFWDVACSNWLSPHPTQTSRYPPLTQHYCSYYATRRSLSWSLHWLPWQC